VTPACSGQTGPGTRSAHRFPAQVMWFAGIGLASTAAYAVLYLALRDLGVTAQAANAASLLLTAVANTTANRRVTFGVRGRVHAGRHQVQGLVAFGAGVLVTSAALAILNAVSARAPRIIEVTVLITANLVATALRFALYKGWVFRPSAEHQVRVDGAGGSGEAGNLDDGCPVLAQRLCAAARHEQRRLQPGHGDPPDASGDDQLGTRAGPQ
jgi:putative flippase GtrA